MEVGKQSDIIPNTEAPMLAHRGSIQNAAAGRAQLLSKV